MQTSQQIDALIDAQLERDIRSETEWTDEDSDDDQACEASPIAPAAACGVFRADEFEGVCEHTAKP